MKRIQFDYSLLLQHKNSVKKEDKFIDDTVNRDDKSFPLLPMQSTSVNMDDNSNDEAVNTRKDLGDDDEPQHTETNLLFEIVNLKEENRLLLKHPLIQSYLMLKWQKITDFALVWLIGKCLFFAILVTLA